MAGTKTRKRSPTSSRALRGSSGSSSPTAAQRVSRAARTGVTTGLISGAALKLAVPLVDSRMSSATVGMCGAPPLAGLFWFLDPDLIWAPPGSRFQPGSQSLRAA
eukprot:scaffold6854_cov118-Isochrysis_galbana.AAC.3